MTNLGPISLFLALALASYSVGVSLLGIWKRDSRFIESARHANYLAPVALGIATASLVGAFVTHDFRVAYVVDHSSRAMDLQYIWVAFYAGNQGSLLFITLVLAIMAALAVYFAPRVLQPSLPYTNVVLMAVLVFFVAVTMFLANPFARCLPYPYDLCLPYEPGTIFITNPFIPVDYVAPYGRGINPLLTHPGMFLHPPFLMAGLIAFAVPFAFAMGALLSGRTGDEWVDVGRTWGILAWAVLGAGNLLGMWWAYTILGWGGYWGWDPVENSSFMPWLVITAFIHSIMVQKRRGMFRMWNLALIIIAFAFAQFGMFLNRGGPVPSIHSFGKSPLGWIFLLFMVFTLLFSFGLFFLRYNRLKSAQTLESALSREASFLINNLLFLSIAFVTLWGVIYPLISDIVQGEIITVGAPFYNQVNGPLFLALIFLMGVAPFLPWRHASWGNLRHALMAPVAAAIVVAGLLVLVGVNKPYAVVAIALCALVTSGILLEWVRGAHSRHKRGEAYPIAFVRLIAGNRPRYGGYIVHLAIVLIALGITGSSFYDVQRDVSLRPDESADVGEYTVKYITSSTVERADRTEYTAAVQVFRGDSFLGTYYPRRDYYPGFKMSSTRATIRSTPIDDLYIIPGEFLDDGRAVFRILVNPLVMWIWVGSLLLFPGLVVALWPQREGAAVYARRPSRGVVASS